MILDKIFARKLSEEENQYIDLFKKAYPDTEIKDFNITILDKNIEHISKFNMPIIFYVKNTIFENFKNEISKILVKYTMGEVYINQITNIINFCKAILNIKRIIRINIC